MRARRLLVTRPEPDAKETAALIEARGAIAVLAPLSRVEALSATWPSRPDRLIASSANALRLEPPFPPDWLDLPIDCVGAKTAEAARRAGFSAVRAAGGDVAGLIAALRQPDRAGSRFVYLCGEPRRPEIEAHFAGRDPPLHLLPRYRIERVAALPEPAASALAERRIDAVLHFSQEGARHFFVLTQAAGLLAAAFQPVQACLSGAIAEFVAGEARRTGLSAALAVAERAEAGPLIGAALTFLDREQFN